METNVLGLPSLTGYTPLKAFLEGQVLKYDFRGVGPIVVDKSGNGNLGRLKPLKDPPRRKIASWLPLEVALKFDGENDFVMAPDDPSLKLPEGLGIIMDIKSRQNEFLDRGYSWTFLIWKGAFGTGNYYITDEGNGGTKFRIDDSAGNRHVVRAPGAIEYGERIRLSYTYRPETGVMKIEKNGEAVSSKNIGDVTPLYTGDQPVIVGGRGKQNYLGDMSYLSIKRL